MASEHTPTPWRVSWDDPKVVLRPLYRDGELAGGIVLHSASRRRGFAMVGKEEQAGNAAFIVRACNAHEALTSAAHDALTFIEAIESKKHVELPAGTALRAALALAEEAQS